MTDKGNPAGKAMRRARRSAVSPALGDRIRKFRTQRRLSQEVLAQRAGISEGWLLQIENGQADPRFSHVVAIARVLAIDAAVLLDDSAAADGQGRLSHVADGATLGQGARQPFPPLAWATQQEESDTERRRFMGALVAASLGLLEPELLAAAIGSPAAVDARTLDDLEAMAREHGRLYWTMRPAVLWPTVYTDVAVARRLHGTAPPSLRRQAARIASQSAWLLGLLARRLDRRLDSVVYLNLAGELAADAEDGPLRAHALIALRAVYSPVTGTGPRPDPDRALRLTAEAASVIGGAAPPLLRTWLHACRAEDNAVLGHRSEVDRDLEAAEAALAQATTRSGDYFEHWDSARLAGFRGNCAVLLGEPDDAIPVLESVVRGTSPALVGPYTAVLTDLAAAYGQRGDVERACAILGDALTAASRAGLPEAVHRVRRTRDARLSGWADARAVRELDDRLRQFATSMEAS